MMIRNAVFGDGVFIYYQVVMLRNIVSVFITMSNDYGNS